MGVDGHMPHTCTIERSTQTVDEHNADVETWAPSTEGQRCRYVERSRAINKTAFGELQVVDRDFMLFPPRADVRAGDRLSAIVDRHGAAIKAGVWRVANVVRRRAATTRHIRVELERFT